MVSIFFVFLIINGLHLANFAIFEVRPWVLAVPP